MLSNQKAAHGSDEADLEAIFLDGLDYCNWLKNVHALAVSKLLSS